MAIYMKLGSIEGNVTEEGYEGWVALDSCAFSAHRNVEMTVGAQSDRSRSTPQLTAISASKASDMASEGLFRASITKTAGEKCEIVFVTSVGDNTVDATQKMKLEDVIVSSYQQSASGEGDAYESLELTYSKIDVEFTSRDKTGGGDKPKHVIYDLATGKGS